MATLSVGKAGFNCKLKGLETPSASAVRVTLCVALTGSAFAVNEALVALEGTNKVAGRVTLGLLAESVTVSPPLGAAALRVTVQESVPGLGTVVVVQEKALNAASSELAFPALVKCNAPPQPDMEKMMALERAIRVAMREAIVVRE